MRALWRYVQVKDNRELLAFVGGGFVALVTAGWVAYTHFSKKEPPDKPRTEISAPNGIAAGTITDSPITINPRAPAATPGTPSAAPR